MRSPHLRSVVRAPALAATLALVSAPLLALARTLPLGLALGGLAHAAAQEDPAELPPVAELVRAIAKEKDDTPVQVFEQLAQHGTEESLRGLVKATARLRQRVPLRRAFKAFHHYRGTPLEGAAADALVEAVWTARRPLAQEAALAALARFPERAPAVYDAVLAGHEERACRVLACDALVPVLGRRGDAASLALVVEHATLDSRAVRYVGTKDELPEKLPSSSARHPHRERVRTALGGARDAEALDVLRARLADEDTAPEWQMLLLEVLAARPEPDPATGEVLVALLAAEDAAVATAAALAVGARGDAPDAERPLRALLEAEDAGSRRAAVVALGARLLTDRRWPAEALRLAQARDVALRLGAATALAELRTPEALEALSALLADREWPVRAAAVAELARLRRLDSVPLLVGRLAAETGRLREDVAGALRLLTGLDLGLQPDRWQAWWRAEGAGFVLPERAAAEAAEAQRRADRLGGRTAASFYGLDVVSERACFVLDVSSSMGSRPRRTPPDGPTRLAIAQEELGKLLGTLGDDRYVNVVFFGSSLDAWADGLTRLDERARKDALAHVEKQTPRGGTALYDALQLAFDDPLVDTVYLLTDGLPTGGEIVDPGRIRAEVARWNGVRRVKIHAVAVGQDSPLLRGLAVDSGGEYRNVR